MQAPERPEKDVKFSQALSDLLKRQIRMSTYETEEQSLKKKRPFMMINSQNVQTPQHNQQALEAEQHNIVAALHRRSHTQKNITSHLYPQSQFHKTTTQQQQPQQQQHQVGLSPKPSVPSQAKFFSSKKVDSKEFDSNANNNNNNRSNRSLASPANHYLGSSQFSNKFHRKTSNAMGTSIRQHNSTSSLAKTTSDFLHKRPSNLNALSSVMTPTTMGSIFSNNGVVGAKKSYIIETLPDESSTTIQQQQHFETEQTQGTTSNSNIMNNSSIPPKKSQLLLESIRLSIQEQNTPSHLAATAATAGGNVSSQRKSALFNPISRRQSTNAAEVQHKFINVKINEDEHGNDDANNNSNTSNLLQKRMSYLQLPSDEASIKNYSVRSSVLMTPDMALKVIADQAAQHYRKINPNRHLDVIEMNKLKQNMMEELLFEQLQNELKNYQVTPTQTCEQLIEALIASVKDIDNYKNPKVVLGILRQNFKHLQQPFDFLALEQQTSFQDLSADAFLRKMARYSAKNQGDKIVFKPNKRLLDGLVEIASKLDERLTKCQKDHFNNITNSLAEKGQLIKQKEKDLEVRFLEENKRQQYVELKQNIENKYIPNFRNMESQFINSYKKNKDKMGNFPFLQKRNLNTCKNIDGVISKLKDLSSNYLQD